MKCRQKLVSLALGLGLTAGSVQAQKAEVNDRRAAVEESPIVQTNHGLFRRGGDWRPAAPVCPTPAPSTLVPSTPTPTTPMPPTPSPAPAPAPVDVAAPEALTGGSQSAFYTPTMFGDISPYLHLSSTGYHGKIADNSSLRPLDRIYAGYNYYHHLGGTDVNGHIETIGFEKTFWDGNASFGMRLPFIQLRGNGSDDSTVGDLFMAGKVALINDYETGNVLSAGLAITVPTSDGVATADGHEINPVFLQPFLGLLQNYGDAYVHGFSSISVPTDDRSVTLWFNSIGVGYWFFRDDTRVISAITPTFEVHVNTPLNNRGSEAIADPNVIGFPDNVNLTTGATIFVNGCSSLGAAFAVPVTGPRPFEGEAIVQFNLRF